MARTAILAAGITAAMVAAAGGYRSQMLRAKMKAEGA